MLGGHVQNVTALTSVIIIVTVRLVIHLGIVHFKGEIGIRRGPEWSHNRHVSEP